MLVGTLFATFCAATASPIWAFYGRLREANQPTTILVRFSIFLPITLAHAFTYLLLGLLLSQLSSPSPLLEPPPLPAPPWFIISLIPPVMLGVLLADITVRLASTTARKKPLRDHVREMAKASLRILLYVSALLGTVTASKVLVFSVPTELSGWSRFFAFAFGLYLLPVSYALMADPGTGSASRPLSIWRYGVTYVGFLLLAGSVYFKHVFPHIPWGLGGGAPGCADIEFDFDSEVEPDGNTHASASKVAVLDRTDRHLLVLEIDATTNETRATEVPLEHVRRLTFCKR